MSPEISKINSDYDLEQYLQEQTGTTLKNCDFSPQAVLQEAQPLQFMKLAYPGRSAFEQEFYLQGATLIAGVDEVGRGCLAGPLVVAAVIMPLNFNCPLNLNDSKKLSAKQREQLSSEIKDKALAWAIEEADVSEIAEFNILEADKRAMLRALHKLQPAPEAVIVDYVDLNFAAPYGSVHPDKGDSKSFNIAAASIIAKVYRDNLMKEMALVYPQYDFVNNKGYGTAKHYAALDKYGPCPQHRELFLRKWRARL